MNVIHRSLREQEARERALVLTAMDIEHQLERSWLAWRIIVPRHEESRAREQWRLYDLENTAGGFSAVDAARHPYGLLEIPRVPDRDHLRITRQSTTV